MAQKTKERNDDDSGAVGWFVQLLPSGKQRKEFRVRPEPRGFALHGSNSAKRKRNFWISHQMTS